MTSEALELIMFDEEDFLLADEGPDFANDESCCCVTCCCPARSYPQVLRARIVAPGCPIDGATSTLEDFTGPFPQTCLRWVSTGWSHDCAPATNIGITMRCPAVEGNSCSDYLLTMTPGNSGCHSSNARVDVPPSECRCGTGCPGDGFYARYNGFALTNRFPGAGCDCCANFDIIIEEVCS